MIVNGSTYLLNGAPQHCALCHAPFIIEDDHIKCWRGKDRQYYCCPEMLISAWSKPLHRRANWEEVS